MAAVVAPAPVAGMHTVYAILSGDSWAWFTSQLEPIPAWAYPRGQIPIRLKSPEERHEYRTAKRQLKDDPLYVLNSKRAQLIQNAQPGKRRAREKLNESVNLGDISTGRDSSTNATSAAVASSSGDNALLADAVYVCIPSVSTSRTVTDCSPPSAPSFATAGRPPRRTRPGPDRHPFPPTVNVPQRTARFP